MSCDICTQGDCQLCCSRTTTYYDVNGRSVYLCEDCTVDHLDFPKLAASLEAAKGRKCINPGCEAHNPPKLRSLTAELKKVIPRPGPITEHAEMMNAEPKLPQFCAHLIEAGDRCSRVMPCPTHPSPEPGLCVCGHPYPHHGGAEHRCYEDCPCEGFTEATNAEEG